MSALYGPLQDLSPSHVTEDAFRSDVLSGLTGDPKSIPCKHLYDKRGSELFDKICELEEYYVTRCELEVMRSHSAVIAQRLGSNVQLIEYGSGSSVKTRLLLNELSDLSSYIPVDVSREHLAQCCQRLCQEYPSLTVAPLAADFSQPLSLPRSDARNIIYFPGSTIGNLTHGEAQRLLKQSAHLCGSGGAMLVGIDLQKDPSVIHAAYNDSQGVTAEFNLNLLTRINRELDADFDLQGFEFSAVYNQRLGRVESALVSLGEQSVGMDDEEFCFAEGELLRTEYSHKYTIPQFERLAQESGFRLTNVWSDRRDYFAVVLLEVDSGQLPREPK